MAQLIAEVEGFSDVDREMTFRVGVIEGGNFVNVIPTACHAEVLCVAPTPEAFAEVQERMSGLASPDPEVRLEVEPGTIRPLFTMHEATEELFEVARRVARDVGLNLGAGQFGGGSDGNFTGALGIPTLDGLGVVGDGVHTKRNTCWFPPWCRVPNSLQALSMNYQSGIGKRHMHSYEHINVKPMTVNVGSEISGVDLRQPSPHAASEIKRALIDRKVLVFRDQELTPHQYKDFMQIFGTPVKEDMDVDAGHPSEVGAIHIGPDERQRINFWHMDHSFRDLPTPVLALYARLLPPVGGDTLFTSLEAAYDGLSERMKSAVERVTCYHRVTTTQKSSADIPRKKRKQWPRRRPLSILWSVSIPTMAEGSSL